MQPEEYEELARLTAEHSDMFDRIRARGVAISVSELVLERIETKLDLLLGDNVPRAHLIFERKIAEKWAGVEERLEGQIAELEEQQRQAEARARLLGPDGGGMG